MYCSGASTYPVNVILTGTGATFRITELTISNTCQLTTLNLYSATLASDVSAVSNLLKTSPVELEAVS